MSRLLEYHVQDTIIIFLQNLRKEEINGRNEDEMIKREYY